MSDSPLHSAFLRQRLAQLTASREACSTVHVPMGHAGIDRALGDGMARAKLHEMIADTACNAAAATGFAAMCAQRVGGAIAWVSVEGSDRTLDPHGMRELGIDPARMLLVQVPDSATLLLVAAEALRCTALGTVVIELWHEPRRIDLTVSRRLVLGAEASGVTALLLRIAVQPVASAAHTRWAVSAAPSLPLTANAPGPPTLDLQLLRQRGGPAGMRWRVEWDRDQTSFRTPLPGGVASIPAHGSLAGNADTARRAAG
jgi:protein ImuA